jgi:hypothetical protein
MAINGYALAGVAVGSIFLYSAVKGKSILNSAQAIITGKSPSTTPQTTGIAQSLAPAGNINTTTGVGPVADAGANETILQNTAAEFGWTGTQWTALNDIENEEAGYSTTVKNPGSGALGIAQALGHGNSNTAGSLGNEYGGYGLTDAQAQQANSGNAAMQSLWMCNYIQSQYGNPVAAQQFHLANGWY